MVTVHHLIHSHSHVVLWLLEELGVGYDLVLHEREESGRSPESLRAVHPAGKSPTIVDNGIAMIESTGVLLYLLDAYGNGRLRPTPGTAEAMRFYQWLTYIEGSAKGPTMQYMRLLLHPGDDATRVMASRMASATLERIEAALHGTKTIVPGIFTAADIQLTFFEELLEGYGQIGNWPNMGAHLVSMRSREAYMRAEAKGGSVGLTDLIATLAARSA